MTAVDRRRMTVVMLATLLGFALRLPLNDSIPPRWDEGWSIAHASLGLGELLRITAADVHPPLYYLLLGFWQQIVGINLFSARYLSVLLSVTAIPLAFVVGKAWSRSVRVGMLAALFMAWLPLGVYYGAVVRMYALAPSFVLLAVYGGSKLVTGNWVPESRKQTITNHQLLFVLGAAGAMYTLYHAVWALAAIAMYTIGAAMLRRQWSIVSRFLTAIALAVVAYVPWLIYAVPQFISRAASESATNIGQQFSMAYFIAQGIRDVTMAQQIGDFGPLLIVAIIVVAIAVMTIGHRRNSAFLNSQFLILNLPLLMIAFTLIGVAFAARQWAFNARMLVCAVPALALVLAWAINQLLVTHHRLPIGRLLAATSCLALVGVYLPTSADFVYRKSLEVFDPYHPHTYRAHIAPNATPHDFVFFNVLSPAGFYTLDRSATDPAWSYALTWDPVIEPRPNWEARIGAAAQAHNRLWLVLYRGLAGKNGDLRGYMDSTFYPARAEWGEEEVFYGLYGAPHGPMQSQPVRDANWSDIKLVDIRLSTSLTPGDIIPIGLTWKSSKPIARNYKIFVHAAKPDGFVIAQHDAQPLNDLRPMTTWPAGEAVRDNHGLALPSDYRGPLTITLGIYDPDTGQRLRTDDGRDEIEIGTVMVGP